MSTELTLLGVPSSAGAHFAGQERAPAHLRAAGLVDALTARGRVVRDLGDTTHASFVTDPGQRRSQSLPRVATVAREVAERIADAYAPDSTLCVLGGDCSVLLGVASGLLRHVERLGLLYFDANVDLNTPHDSLSGIHDSMGIAHAIGLIDDELSRIGPRFPLLPDDDIVLFGYHPAGLEAAEYATLRRRSMPSWSLDAAVAEPGASDAAVAWLEGRCERYLVHFDVDFLDFTAFPVANFPHYHPDATFKRAMAWLARFTASPRFGGLLLTEFNPDRDPDGGYARKLVAGLADALALSASAHG